MDTLFSNNPLSLAEVLSKHRWGQVAKARVAPLAMIKDFNVLPNGSLRLSPGVITVVMDPLTF